MVDNQDRSILLVVHAQSVPKMLIELTPNRTPKLLAFQGANADGVGTYVVEKARHEWAIKGLGTVNSQLFNQATLVGEGETNYARRHSERPRVPESQKFIAQS